MVLRTVYGVVLAVSAVLSLAVGVAGLVRQRGVTALSLAGLCGAAALWAGAVLGEMLAEGPTKMAFRQATQVGVVSSVACLFVFALSYVGWRSVLSRRTLPLLAVEPLAVVTLAGAYPATELFWRGWGVNSLGLLEMTNGPAYYVHAVYTYLLAGAALYLILSRARKARNLGPEMLAVAGALAAPVSAGVVDGLNLLALDLTPVAFVVAGVGLFAGVTEFGLLERSPVVRDRVVDAITDPIVVVDGRVIVDANAAFERLFDAQGAVGEPLSAVLADHPGLREHIEAGTDDVVETETPQGRRALKLSVSRVRDESGGSIGRLALLHDVTEQQRQRRELERQNEQLDQFASLISHDLRNPLDVAMGRTNVLAERVDDEDVTAHLAEVADAHSRMRRIIDDVLTLARQGRSIDERERVELVELAEDAWSHVDTDAATLTVETELTVSADYDRLAQVFENLFRNAVQHAGADAAVTVGESPDGFFIADDGPGIPPAEREQVLEAGYTDHDAGTGLGLAIVTNVVEAHGWELSVATAADGGARFEISGVEAAAAA